MPTNPHYEAVRARVVAACPELMELSFGCYVKSKYHPAQERVTEDFSDSLIQCESSTVDKKEIEIIGHPIRLSHILRTLEIKRPGRYEVIGNGGIKRLDTKWAYCQWNLEKDSLESQDPSVWEALDKMLSV